MPCRRSLIAFCLVLFTVPVLAQTNSTPVQRRVGVYEYETRPDDEAFRPFNPRKAPQPGPLLLTTGDRLAICGDSITEQKMYSRIIETYLTACMPELKVTARQYGWSGETAQGFLNRMEKDCLTFEPTVATLCYGMNDARYRPFDINNGYWYEDNYSAVVQNFKAHGVKVVLGSPGCAGKIATWVQSRAGTLQEHNLNLCALRDIAIGIAEREHCRFADIFWPMYQAQVFAPQQHGATEQNPYHVAGSDGIHPGWAGQVIMAYAMLRGLGLQGDLGTVQVDLRARQAKAEGGHEVKSFDGSKLVLVSHKLPFCARGDEHQDSSIRSGMTLVPFAEELNRFRLIVSGEPGKKYRITWGSSQKEFSGETLGKGILLAQEFPENPLCEMFDRVDQAVAAKQAYETQQIKQAFHSREAKQDFKKIVEETEAIRAPLAEAVATSLQPVTHELMIEAL